MSIEKYHIYDYRCIAQKPNPAFGEVVQKGGYEMNKIDRLSTDILTKYHQNKGDRQFLIIDHFDEANTKDIWACNKVLLDMKYIKEIRGGYVKRENINHCAYEIAPQGEAYIEHYKDERSFINYLRKNWIAIAALIVAIIALFK